jgi:hypothetical protein
MNIYDVFFRKSGKKGKSKHLKEISMDLNKLNKAMDELKEISNGGAVACDIYTSRDGQSIGGYNSNPVASAMFNQITQHIVTTMKQSEMPTLGKYYIVELAENKAIVIIHMGDYQWGMLLDTKLCSLGLMINIVIPQITKLFQQAVPA